MNRTELRCTRSERVVQPPRGVADRGEDGGEEPHGRGVCARAARREAEEEDEVSFVSLTREKTVPLRKSRTSIFVVGINVICTGFQAPR